MPIYGTQMMRDGALEKLNDADLSFSPGGDSPTLGELFKRQGEIQHSYSESLRTRKHDWSFTYNSVSLTSHVDELTAWFSRLDRDMEDAMQQLTDDDLLQQVDRSGGVFRTVERQISIYLEAMLIFLGKLVVYFQAMQRALPDSIQHYIA